MLSRWAAMRRMPIAFWAGTLILNLLCLAQLTQLGPWLGTALSVALTFVLLLLGKSEVRLREERAAAEEAVRRHRGELADLLENAPLGFHWVDPKGNILYANASFLALLGYSREEIVGRHVGELVVDAPTAAALLDCLSRPEPAREFEARLRTKRGETAHVLIDTSIYRENGEFVFTRCFSRDITERKRMEDDLRRAKEAAEAASLAKSSFLANMSHEIRTPMTAILGYADFLQEPDQPEDDRKSCVQVIRQNGQHLLAILNDILDLSKIEAGKMVVERIPCSPSQLVAEVVSLLQVRAKEKRLGLEVEFLGPIPETIRSDPTRLRQILLNIIGNAIKFTELGSIRVCVSLLDPGDMGSRPYFCMEVVDSGVGMTELERKAVFKAFGQGDVSTTRKHGGTGLGLVISKRFAQMLGGDIVLQTNKDEGTSFIIAIDPGPLDSVKLVEISRDLPLAQLMPTSKSKMPGLRIRGQILVAEDVEVNQKLIVRHLTRAGATVSTAQNGRIALEKALQAERDGKPFDLILMDMAMPELDGYQATQELRRAGYEKPIVALTAHSMANDRERCISVGCDDHLAKPIDFERLIATAHRFTSSTSSLIPAPGILPEWLEVQTDPELRDILDEFLEWLPHQIEIARQALGGLDYATVMSVAHALKGVAGSCGFGALMASARDLEASAKGKADPESLASAFRALEREASSALSGHKA